MALTKFKLGDLIQPVDERNSNLKYDLNSVRGISIQKIFIPTKADMEGVSLAPYILVEPDSFAYVPVTSRNGGKITIAHNTTEKTFIVSSSYIVFKVSREEILLSDYLFVFFNRPEFDRYARFHSWGSAREIFSWAEMCDIEIQLPPIEIQKKFVAVYNSMLANQKIYERGLDDLKLVCDGYIDKIKHTAKKFQLGKFICKRNERYFGNKKLPICGVSREGLIPAKKYSEATNQIFYKDDFIFNPARMELNSIGLNRTYEKGLCSTSYEIFFVTDKEKILPEYLNLFVKRNEFARFCDFISMGSVREIFSFSEICEVEIPIPDIKIQKSISEIYNIYQVRKKLAEELKLQLRNICPILIKGALNEGERS